MRLRMEERPRNLDRFCMHIATIESTMSPCKRTKVGAAAVIDDVTCVSTSCGNELCRKKVCLRFDVESGSVLESCRGLHAEQKLLLKLKGEPIESIYVTHFPCSTCAKLIAHYGIKDLYYKEDWGDQVIPRLILEESKVTIHQIREDD